MLSISEASVFYPGTKQILRLRLRMTFKGQRILYNPFLKEARRTRRVFMITTPNFVLFAASFEILIVGDKSHERGMPNSSYPRKRVSRSMRIQKPGFPLKACGNDDQGK